MNEKHQSNKEETIQKREREEEHLRTMIEGKDTEKYSKTEKQQGKLGKFAPPALASLGRREAEVSTAR